MPKSSQALKKEDTRQPQSHKLTEEQQRALLAGLPRYCIGAQILLGEPLIAPSGLFLDGSVWLPKKGDPMGERYHHRVVAIDLGKFQFKYGGINERHYFQSTYVIDAYAKAQQVEHDQKNGEQIKGLKSWTLLMEHGELRPGNSAYWLGEEALPWVKGKFPLLDISMRVKETRFREQYYAGLAMELEKLGVDFFTVSDDSPLEEAISKAPINYIIAALALPHKDMRDMSQATKTALRNMEGEFVVMRTNTATGEKQILKGYISDTYVYDQPRGTDTAISLQADGDPANWDEDWEKAAKLGNLHEQDEFSQVTARTIIDPGGGDCHLYFINDEGTVTYLGSWQGEGTIEISRALIPVVEKNHGVLLSEAQAQQALYTRRIRGAGGRTVRIDKEINSLHYERDNLIARIDIKDEMRSSLIACTGGGTAVFGELLKEKLEGMGLREREHFLILNKALAPIANAAGITLRACLKAHAQEAKLNEKLLEQLIETYETLLSSVSGRRHELRNQIISILDQLRWYAQVQEGEDPQEGRELPELDWPILQQYLQQVEKVRAKIA